MTLCLRLVRPEFGSRTLALLSQSQPELVRATAFCPCGLVQLSALRIAAGLPEESSSDRLHGLASRQLLARFTGVGVIAFEIAAIERAKLAEKQGYDGMSVDVLRTLAEPTGFRPEHF